MALVLEFVLALALLEFALALLAFALPFALALVLEFVLALALLEFALPFALLLALLLPFTLPLELALILALLGVAFALLAAGVFLLGALAAFTDFVFRVPFVFVPFVEFDAFFLRVVFLPVLIFTTIPVLALGAGVAAESVAFAAATAFVVAASFTTFAFSLTFALTSSFFSASVAAFIALSK